MFQKKLKQIYISWAESKHKSVKKFILGSTRSGWDGMGIYIFYISQSTYWLKIYYAHQETSYFYPHNPCAAHVHIQILPSTFSGGKHGININGEMKRIKADTSSTKSYKIRHKGECRAVIPHSHTFRP